MKMFLIKVLTLLTFLGISGEVYAEILKIENAKNYLRWNIYSPKDLLFVKKKNNVISLKTLDVELFQKLSKDLEDMNLDKRYFSNIDVSNAQNNTSVLEVKVTLKNKYIESFNFYRDREKKHVVDFWIDKENQQLETPKKQDPKAAKILTTRKSENKNLKAKVAAKKPKMTVSKLAPSKVKKSRSDVPASVRAANSKEYRDFRYGGSFMWDYDPIYPKLKFDISLARKTPEFFYKVKDRDFKKNDREAHLQLMINLYRKKKWGLMYKSMKLFEQKYKAKSEEENLIEYLKANAILKDNILGGKGEPVKTAIAMLENVNKRSKEYPLRKGIYRYLLNYYYSKNLLLKSLEYSKAYYLDSKENFDYEESAFAAESIIQSLARVGNHEKLKQVVNEKTIKKIVPSQTLVAYELFSLLKLGKEEEVIKVFNKKKSGLVRPITPSILYNVAEAYFREGDFKNAIKYFDEFIANNSHMTVAGRARVRIALSYEILEDDHRKVAQLYKNAINRTNEELTQMEARIRYVALTSVRKLKPTEDDKELRIFLDRGKSNVKFTKPMEKLLWQVRLRIFINDGDYDKALAYLNAIPLRRFTYSERRVFESDGAEIIYGMIQDNFIQDNSSKVIALWDNYKKKYVEKVALDPYLNYLVGRSYVKLGFYNAFDKLLNDFNNNSKITTIKTYPMWVERKSVGNANFLLSELQIIKDIKLENWDSALKKVNSLSKTEKNSKLNFYKGILHYRKKNYKQATKEFEIFVSSNKTDSLEDEDYAELLYAYTDSVYNSKDMKKFKQVSNALLEDFKGFKTENAYFKGIKERIRYLNLEVLASDDEENTLVLESKMKKYLENYEKSNYNNRISYLLSKTLIKNKKENEATKVLEELVNKETVPAHLKEMARSELTLLKIKSR